MEELKDIGVEIYKSESGHLLQTLPMGLSEVIYGYTGPERREFARRIWEAAKWETCQDDKRIANVEDFLKSEGL